jgi:hypothetical protein
MAYPLQESDVNAINDDAPLFLLKNKRTAG